MQPAGVPVGQRRRRRRGGAGGAVGAVRAGPSTQGGRGRLGSDVDAAQELGAREGAAQNVVAEEGHGLLPGEDLLGVQPRGVGGLFPDGSGQLGPGLGVPDGLTGYGVVDVPLLIGHPYLQGQKDRRAHV